MRLPAVVAFAFGMLVSAVAGAQDYGREWVDRITHQLIDEEAPLSTHPLTYQATLGELYQYDSNIFLTDANRTSDSIFLTFAQAQVEVAGPSLDASFDLALDYVAYAHERDADGDEERFFGRVRYQGSRIMIQISEIARREASPTDVVFVNRVPRFLSDTTPLIIVHMTDSFFLEVQSDYQYVKFLRKGFGTADNANTRSTATLGYRTSLSDMDVLAQAGYLTINYHDPASPPNAQGEVARLGVRGELFPRLRVTALAGVTKARSDDFPGTNLNVEHTTGDAEVHLLFTPGEIWTVYADYSRRIGWSVPTPFEVVDSSDVIGEVAVRDDLKLRARLQYDRVHGPLTVTRTYYSGTFGVEVAPRPRVLLDGSITYRQGAAVQPGGAGDFKDVVLSIGIAVTFN